MKKTYQSGLDSAPANFVTAKTLIAKIAMLMVISILAVGGLIDNGWALPGGQCIVDQIAREPFMTADGFGNLSPVYQRQTVIAGYDANRDGNFLPAVGVYYDVLSPKGKILQEDPQ